MSQRYKGGVISATPPTLVAGAGASGTWTLEQQMQATAAGLWPVNGPFYIEDVFSTYLYTGNGTARSIVNGIDLSTKGGLTWIKNRTSASYPHMLYDTVRGATKSLSTNDAVAQLTYADSLTAFNTTGFSLGADTVSGNVNNSGENYASWTFREQPKFFDVVTYTGTGSNTTIAHNLGSVPGCIIVKRTDTTSNWAVWHVELGNGEYLQLNTTSAKTLDSTVFQSTNPTSTIFRVGTSSLTNASGGTYVAYLFAHDAGGFGLTGTDNVISCGSYTGNGSSTGPVIDLGYEPQWLLIKKADSATTNTGWAMFDNMRGLRNSGGVFLYANSSAAEDSSVNIVSALATGFQPVQSGFLTNGNGSTYIYIAIRRGPMKVPTSGTSVFTPVATTGVAGAVNVTTNFPVDLIVNHRRNDAAGNNWWDDRLRGADTLLRSNTTGAEATGYYPGYPVLNMTTVTYPDDPSQGFWNYPGITYANWFFRRAPSFFDEVCYTGTGSATTVTHNLGVAPELMIVKDRSTTYPWDVYHKDVGASAILQLNTTGATINTGAVWNNTTPTASVFSIGTNVAVNTSGNNYVAYLFATCAGVSKVGSYTGTGALQTINCGFTGGARFVMIKRTDSTGDWYMYDSARGITSGNDPYVFINDIAAEVTGTNYVDTDSTGFKVTAAAPAGLNASGGTYIFLAIA